MKVIICNRCYGKSKIVNREKLKLNPELTYSETDFPYLPCPDCNNTGLLNEGNDLSFLNSLKSIQGIRYSEGIFGNLETKIRLVYKNPKGFDLWQDNKKITRGNKYLIAGNISMAIAGILKGNEYRKDLYFEFFV